MALKPGPWSKKAQQHKNTDAENVWGHDDPPLPQPGALQSEMATFLSGIPASHWRPRVGAIIIKKYGYLLRCEKQAGVMVTDDSGVKFNIILDSGDEAADILVLHRRLLQHFMLCPGSSGREMLHISEKATEGDHASPWDIIFRTAGLHTYKMGLTKNEDMTRSKQDTGIRHAWIQVFGWVANQEEKQEMANLLCHLVGFQPAYPQSFGGAIPPAIGGGTQAAIGCAWPPPLHQPSSCGSAESKGWLQKIRDAARSGFGCFAKARVVHYDTQFCDIGKVHVEHDTGEKEVLGVEDFLEKMSDYSDHQSTASSTATTTATTRPAAPPPPPSRAPDRPPPAPPSPALHPSARPMESTISFPTFKWKAPPPCQPPAASTASSLNRQHPQPQALPMKAPPLQPPAPAARQPAAFQVPVPPDIDDWVLLPHAPGKALPPPPKMPRGTGTVDPSPPLADVAPPPSPGVQPLAGSEKARASRGAAAACAAEHAEETVTMDTHFKDIDDLVEIASLLGYPVWHTPGQGGYRKPWPEPSRPILNFEKAKLKQCARLDMLRGIHGEKGYPSDDKQNSEWSDWLAHLPQFERRLRTKQNPQCTRGRGDAVEMIGGLAYAAYMDGRNLPADHRLVWPSPAAREAWAAVWMPMTRLGVTVHREIKEEMHSSSSGDAAAQKKIFERVVFEELMMPVADFQRHPESIQLDTDTFNAPSDTLEQAQVGAAIHVSMTEDMLRYIDVVPDALQLEAALEQLEASAQFNKNRIHGQPLAATPVVESDPRPAIGGYTGEQKPCVEVLDPVNHMTPRDWLRSKLSRGATAQQIRQYVADFRATEEGKRFKAAVLGLLAQVLVKVCNPPGPSDKKLLKNTDQKVRGFDPSRTALQGEPIPESVSGVAVLPGLGVHFDVDWDNVTEFFNMLKACKVADSGDHTGNWELVHSIMANFQRNLDPTIH